MKLIFFCALSCFLLALFIEVKYYDSFYLLRIKQCAPVSTVHQGGKHDCLNGIIQMLKIVSLNGTNKDNDLNLKALDLLTSTIQNYILANSIQRTGLRDIDLDGELHKLEELRNEIRNRKLKQMLEQRTDRAENGVKENREQQNEIQNNVETNKGLETENNAETNKNLETDDNTETNKGLETENNAETNRDLETQNNTETNKDLETENNPENMNQYEYHNYQEREQFETLENEEGHDINLSEVLTIVLNFNNYTYKDLAFVDKMLKDITTIFPGVRTVVSSPYKLNRSFIHENLTVILTDKRTHPGRLWASLIDLVLTTHVLILRDVVSIDDDSRLCSLMYNLKSLDIDVIGGAVKDISSGHWQMGCYQMAYRNYVLVYKPGYRHSKNSCVYCHHISGPFIAKTSLLKQYNFTDDHISGELIFHDFFFNQFKNQSKFAICPDSMFVTRTRSQATDRSQWLRFGLKNNIHRMVIPSGITHTYSCKELGVVKNSIDDGKSVPYCTIQELINHIKFIMRTCRGNLIICELSWGIELGAVKLHRVAPWEHDGDVSFYTPQADKLLALEPLFEENGYSLYLHRYTGEWDSPWLRSNSKWWHVDLFNRTHLDSAEQILQGKSPTKVLFDGEWMETSNNVGYSIKRGYGPEIYQHKDYSMTYSQSYMGLHYVPCPDGQGQDCIDKLPPDGNLDMGDPIP